MELERLEEEGCPRPHWSEKQMLKRATKEEPKMEPNSTFTAGEGDTAKNRERENQATKPEAGQSKGEVERLIAKRMERMKETEMQKAI